MQSLKTFIPPFLPTCEREGDNDKALTWGRDLINLFFPKDVYRRSLFFFLTLRARSRSCSLATLARLQFFRKERWKRKRKQRLCAGYHKAWIIERCIKQDGNFRTFWQARVFFVDFFLANTPVIFIVKLWPEPESRVWYSGREIRMFSLFWMYLSMLGHRLPDQSVVQLEWWS